MPAHAANPGPNATAVGGTSRGARLEPGYATTQSASPGLYNGRKAQWVVPALWL